MWFIPLALAATSFLSSAINAKEICPLYGPLLPRPTNLLQAPGIIAAGQILDGIFADYIDNDKSTGSDHFSYAVEVFSGSEEKPLWSHYWTAPNLKDFNSSGVKQLDTNSVYRIGSITKVFTVLSFLASVGDGIWNDPITKHLPEIEEIFAKSSDSSPIFAPDWDAITVGSLASQTSGLMRDYALLGELSYQLNLTDLYAMGFPPIPLENFPPCGSYPTCNRTQLFQGLERIPPSFGPFTTPTYSNIGFVLLSYIAERKTGKEFKTLVKEKVLDPLNLKHTFLSAPDQSLGIIPGNLRSTSWGYELAEESATGNMYASPGDLSALGRAIMSSKILKPSMTRRWLKPVAFTSDPLAAVGSPWGIRQLNVGPSKNSSYQIIHTFNKAGSLGAYSTLLAIMPELDIGFTIMAAGDPPAGLAMDIADTLTSTYMPTMMYVARTQAEATFGGQYRAVGVVSNNSSAPANNITTHKADGSPRFNMMRRFTNSSQPLNSSLTISLDASKPGLGVTQWISNGTEIAYIAAAINSNISREYFDQMRPSVRLYPTGLEEKLSNGGKKVAFKAVFEDLGLPGKTGSFSSDCATWVGVTAVVYGSRPLDLFIFEMDASGKVKAVENAALRVRLEKVS